MSFFRCTRKPLPLFRQGLFVLRSFEHSPCFTHEIFRAITRVIDAAIDHHAHVDAWVDKLAGGLTEEAKGESGWCKIRDGIVLPYVLKSLAYFGRQVLLSTMEHTIEA